MMVIMSIMMDMMTIILVFLLKSYSTQDISIAPSEDLELPVSTVQKAPEMAVNVVVSKKNIVVDGVPVLSLEKAPDPDNPGQSKLQIPEDQKNGQLIDALLDELARQEERRSTDRFSGPQESGAWTDRDCPDQGPSPG